MTLEKEITQLKKQLNELTKEINEKDVLIDDLKKQIEIYKQPNTNQYIYIRCEHCLDNNPDFN